MAFKGKVALITGGASGMGRVMALRLASGGAHVAILDMNREGLEATASLATGIRAFPCDVSDARAVAAVVSEVETEIGPIDRLASAAGIMPALSITDMPVERFSQVMRINYEGMVNVVKAGLPPMLSRGHGDDRQP